jgi:hypothetical protein
MYLIIVIIITRSRPISAMASVCDIELIILVANPLIIDPELMLSKITRETAINIKV